MIRCQCVLSFFSQKRTKKSLTFQEFGALWKYCWFGNLMIQPPFGCNMKTCPKPMGSKTSVRFPAVLFCKNHNICLQLLCLAKNSIPVIYIHEVLHKSFVSFFGGFFWMWTLWVKKPIFHFFSARETELGNSEANERWIVMVNLHGNKGYHLIFDRNPMTSVIVGVIFRF